jgi:hypothetical protein
MLGCGVYWFWKVFMVFIDESFSLLVSSFVSEHAQAQTLIAETGELNTRWVDVDSNSVLYLISKEDCAHGISFFKWILFVNTVPLHLWTSGYRGPGAPSWQLQRVSSDKSISEFQKVALLRVIEDASRGYMGWYDKKFWGTNAWLDSTLKIDGKNTEWVNNKWTDE